MRGIDYLLTRKDVDGARIGCTGCSGGGTLTTYISALDDRVKAAAPACYITSWRELLTRLGPQDGEQVFPGFLKEQLDIADFVELFAPKPWLIANTIDDFFPLEGARQTYEEARRWYALFGAEDRIAWHIGPGGHGTPLQSREAIYAWFIRWLKDGKGDAREPRTRLDEPDALLVTQTGQVADSLGGETVFTINRRRAADLIVRGRPQNPALSDAIREQAVIGIVPGGAPPPVSMHRTLMRPGYRVDLISLETAPGVNVPAMLAIPTGSGPKPAMLLLDPRSREEVAAPGGDFDSLARSGRVVLALAPRGVPETTPRGRPALLGEYGAAMRAAVVGRTLVGMRAEDTIRAVDYLVSRPDVNAKQVAAFGEGSLGVPLLHAAVLDKRIEEVVVQDTLGSYQLAVDKPLHRSLYDVAVPGVLRRYDLEHLATAMGPARVTLLNPVDAAGNPLRLEPLRKRFADSPTVSVRYRGRRDPLTAFMGAVQRP
jgi:dienelactone hydrolase